MLVAAAAPAAPSLGLFGAPKTETTEKKDAPAGNTLPNLASNPALIDLAPSFGLFGAPKDASAEKKDPAPGRPNDFVFLSALTYTHSFIRPWSTFNHNSPWLVSQTMATCNDS